MNTIPVQKSFFFVFFDAFISELFLGNFPLRLIQSYFVNFLQIFILQILLSSYNND